MSLKGQTIAFIGCGNMGSALLDALLTEHNRSELGDPSYLACTKSEASARRLTAKYEPYQAKVEVVADRLVAAAQKGDIVILGFKPYMMEEVLSDSEFVNALDGKLVISIIGGWSCAQMQELAAKSGKESINIFFARGIPTIACRYHESVTSIEKPEKKVQDNEKYSQQLDSIFRAVGMVSYVAPELMDVATILVGGSMATFSVAMEGWLDGAVAEGFRRQEATAMVTRGLRGLAALLEDGETPSSIREAMSSPRGATIASLITTEKAGTRGVFAESMINGSRVFKK